MTNFNNNYKNPFVIAEIGCNHKGDLEIAKEMIEIAKIFCKVDAVKFQKRTIKEMLTEEEYNQPHGIPHNSYGDTYGKHREFLEFTIDQHKTIKDYCEKLDIIYSCSIWDMTSAKEIVSLNPDFIKIPSALNTNFDILSYLCDNYKGKIHVSLGMTSKQEIEEIVQFFISRNRNNDLTIYHCVSGYPLEPHELCLLEIKTLCEKYADKVENIGFSGHHSGISQDIAAYTLGANFFERHFTLNRTWKGTDHAASLEPDGLRRVTRDLKNAQLALSYKATDLLEVEEVQRGKLKWDRNQK